MSVTTQKYVRKPFEVDAVQVTAENLAAVADWCLGEVVEENGARYIKVKVPRVLNERQTKAFVGDWVLHAGGGFKVYMSKAFNQSFDRTGNPPRQMKTTTEKLGAFATTVHDKVVEAKNAVTDVKLGVDPTPEAGVTVISTNAPEPVAPQLAPAFAEPTVDKPDPYRRPPPEKTGLV